MVKFRVRIVETIDNKLHCSSAGAVPQNKLPEGEILIDYIVGMHPVIYPLEL